MPEDTSKGSEQDASKALFAGLIMMLGSSAMQQLGKLVDPSSGKSAVSLEGAQSTIDLLASLQMNYVQVAETMKKTPAEPTSAAAAPKSADAQPEPAPNAEQPESPSSATAEPEKKESHEPKFHKSYGA